MANGEVLRIIYVGTSHFSCIRLLAKNQFYRSSLFTYFYSCRLFIYLLFADCSNLIIHIFFLNCLILYVILVRNFIVTDNVSVEKISSAKRQLSTLEYLERRKLDREKKGTMKSKLLPLFRKLDSLQNHKVPTSLFVFLQHLRLLL